MHDLNWTILIPSLILSGFIILVLCLDIVWPKSRGVGAAYTSLVGVLVALASLVWLWDGLKQGSGELYGIGGMMIMDPFALFANAIFLIGTGLAIVISIGYLEREEGGRNEYYLLILAATLGMILMAAGTDLIVIFLGIELMSISLYILVGFLRTRQSSN